MKKRPTSITVISWILIVMSAISFVTTIATFNNPMVRDLASKNPIPLPLQFVMLYVGLAVTLASGIFMLRGNAWARNLYVAWSVLGFLIGFATSPTKMLMIPGVMLFIVIAIFLFRRSANEFFLHRNPLNDGQSN